MNAVIVHGIMGKAGENWGLWLHDELVTRSITVTMPSLSNTDHPDRSQWLAEISALIKDPADTIIIAHSLGVTSALDFLEQSPIPIKGLVSVSGFSDSYGLELNNYFLSEKSIDFEQIRKNAGKVFVLYGDDDPYVPQRSLHLLAENLKVAPLIISSGGHLNTAAGFAKFPQLLEITLSI